MSASIRQTERHLHVEPASADLQRGTTSCGFARNWYYLAQLRQPANQLGSDIGRNSEVPQGGKSHVGLPMSFAAEFPDMYTNMKQEERDTRALIGSDQCLIDQQRFSLRGRLEVRILSSEEPFVWGLWVSVKEEIYDEVSDFWTLEGGEKLHGPYKARLGNSLTAYPETLNLKTAISLQPVGTRPLFRIGETNHLLA